MKAKTVVLNLVFGLIAILILIGTLTDTIWLDYPVKPLIMLWLGIMFLSLTKPQPYRWLVIQAFFFSWLGDVLLMLSHKNEMLFFAGVGSFFLSQVTYIIVFSKFAVAPGKGFIGKHPVWALPFLVYMVAIYLLLYTDLEGIMKPVVALYAISLIGMAIAGFNRRGLTPNPAFLLLITGSVFFVISDSLLAINKFSTEIPQSGLLVMSTYMIAQYLIMRGLVRSEGVRK